VSLSAPPSRVSCCKGSKLIRRTLGYGKTETLLLTAPPYILAAGWFYLISLYSDRTNKIYIVIVTCLGMAFVAYITALSTLVTGARYFAMMLMPSACCESPLLLASTHHRKISSELVLPILAYSGVLTPQPVPRS
jgi:hypothetical protein